MKFVWIENCPSSEITLRRIKDFDLCRQSDDNIILQRYVIVNNNMQVFKHYDLRTFVNLSVKFRHWNQILWSKCSFNFLFIVALVLVAVLNSRYERTWNIFSDVCTIYVGLNMCAKFQIICSLRFCFLYAFTLYTSLEFY
jgi:hypothetical protein